MSNNNYDNPSSNMRVNTKLLKHILLVADWVINKEDSPSLIKTSAKELKLRTDKYCSEHFTKVYEEIDRVNQMNIERF
jgi:tetrahydromethanopterin S-methyltransferase subunit H